jgi:hypothetical protein
MRVRINEQRALDLAEQVLGMAAVGERGGLLAGITVLVGEGLGF